MRLAIFGGSFDPPHVGHLLAAVDACEQLELDRIILVPASVQPLKAGVAVATPQQRLEMTRLLAAGDPRFEVSTVEVERSGLSFTVDTLAHFAERYPAAERFLLLGGDVLGTFAKWREPDRIARLARLVLLERQIAGAGAEGTDSLSQPLPAILAGGDGMPGALRLPTRRIDVSSTEIRERVRKGKSIRGFVTDSVAAFIERSGLYR